MPLQKIQWLEWNKSSFEKARKENKPIILDIHGTWCHWCHIMDETTYSNPQIIEIVNKEFIPIKVDTDKRPDINAQYNAGGWPTTAILTPNSSVIQNATYLPPYEMTVFLKSGVNNFRTFGAQVDAQAKTMQKIQPAKKFLFSQNELVQTIVSNAKESFDEKFGGFGLEPKFPMAELLEFLGFYQLFYRDAGVEPVLKTTLDAMSQGKLFDQVEHGFFRYSTTRDWSIPHFEKMLEDNAQLLSVYASAAKLFESKKYEKTVEQVADFLLEQMFDSKQKMFYSSINADEKYYFLDAGERKKLQKPSVDKTFYTGLNALTVQAFLKAGVLLDKKEFVQIGIDCLNAVYDNCVSKNGVNHFAFEKNQSAHFLFDYAQLASVLFKAFIYTGEKIFLEKAENVLGLTYKIFFDEQKKAFFDSVTSDGVELPLQKVFPAKLNSLMAKNYLFLGEFLENKKYSDLAESLNFFAMSNAVELSIFGAFCAQVALIFEKGLIHAKIPTSFGQSNEFLRDFLFNDFDNLVVTRTQSKKTLVCVKQKCVLVEKPFKGLWLHEKIE